MTNQKDILNLIQSDLKKTRERLEHWITSHDAVVQHMSHYIAGSPGKMLRPAMVLLTAGMLDRKPEGIHDLAALVELLHTATLVHDDIIDEAETRRGQQSVNRVFGNETTVLMGDWLYMTAFEIAVQQRNFPILDVLIDVTKKMVEGEILQLDLLDKVDLDLEEHLDIASRKTAYLFSACTRIAGLACGCDAHEQDRLFTIGLNLGLAFQLIDDVLDFTAEEAKLGKPIMNDLREGKVTLPVIYLLEEDRPEYREMIGTIIRERGFNTVTSPQLREVLDRHNCIGRAMEFAKSYARIALEQIMKFSPSPYRDSFSAIADFIIQREH